MKKRQNICILYIYIYIPSFETVRHIWYFADKFAVFPEWTSQGTCGARPNSWWNNGSVDVPSPNKVKRKRPWKFPLSHNPTDEGLVCLEFTPYSWWFYPSINVNGLVFPGKLKPESAIFFSWENRWFPAKMVPWTNPLNQTIFRLLKKTKYINTPHWCSSIGHHL